MIQRPDNAGEKIGAAKALSALPLWQSDLERDAIIREFRFTDFRAAMAFMNAIADIAEAWDHHPEWSNVYNRVRVLLTTHDSDGVTRLDLAMAQQMDRIAISLGV